MGHLAEVEFLGPHTRLHVELPHSSTGPLLSLLPSAQLATRRLRVGHPLRLAFNPHDAVLLPEENNKASTPSP